MKKKWRVLLAIFMVCFFILFSFYLVLRFTPRDQAISFDNLRFPIISSDG